MLIIGRRSIFGASCAGELFEHRTKRQLHLVRVHRLGLLAEQLTLEPLQLEEHERVELALLLAFVLRAFTLLLGAITLLSETTEFGFERSDSRLRICVVWRRTLTHAPG